MRNTLDRARDGAGRVRAGYYAGRAARRVFADKTIWWRAAVLSAVQLIPFLGAFVVGGYSLIVMRDAAWGVERGLPRFSDKREILRRGLDAFVVSLVWYLPLVALLVLGMCGWMVTIISAVRAGSVAPVPPPWFATPLLLPLAVLAIFVNVALLRAAVYLHSSAGLSVRAVRQLIGLNRDRFKFVAWLPVALALVGLVLSAPGMFLTRSIDPPLASIVANLSSFLVGLVQIPLSLVVSTAYGIWGSETDPSTWPPLRSVSTETHAATRYEGVVGEDPL